MAREISAAESQPTLPIPPEASVLLATLVSFSGGFLDAFTYVGHGRVFANAMTGNVVLLGVSSIAGDWLQAGRHLPPLFAFVAGVMAAQVPRLPRFHAQPRHTAIFCLALEIAVLVAASFLPQSFPDMVLVLAICFVAALQNSSFTRLETSNYNSVMTTGNLRRFAELIFHATLVERRNPALWRQARLFGGICLCFLSGATVGGFATVHWSNVALWFPAIVLSLGLGVCLRPPSGSQ